MPALFYYSFPVSLVGVCTIIWAICVCLIFFFISCFSSTVSFDWRLAMTEDNGTFGTQWGVCHCWLQRLLLFFLSLHSWFSLALWETIIKLMSHYKILCDPMVIFKSLSIFEISLFILSNGKLHRYFPFTLQQKVARLLSALGESNLCAQFVLFLILALIT